MASIEQDYYEMNCRATLAQEYIFVSNGDARSFSDASAELVEAIQAMIESNTGGAGLTMGFKRTPEGAT